MTVPSSHIGMAGAPATESTDLFGHPRGLTYLFATEMWERFSFYGMRSLLVLYMVKYLFKPERAADVFGYTQMKNFLEYFTGPLSVQVLASNIYGLYTGLVYLTPLLGGYLADRVVGQRRIVIVGAVLMAIAQFMLTMESLFFLGLLVLIIGNGAFKPNISTQVGALYAPGDSRRDRAYSIFYVGINVGAFLAPLIAGTLGEEWGWRYGFASAGVGMLIGLGTYLYALPTLPTDELHKAKAAGDDKRPLNQRERRAVWALIVLFAPVTLFWAAYEQQGNTIVLWVADRTDRSINLLFWAGEIPTTWFQAFNPFMIFAFTPFIVALWAWQDKHGIELSSITKMSIGCFGVAVAYLIMAIAAWQPAGEKASWLWLLGFFVAVTLGELYLSPIGLSLVSKVAPARVLSLMMGLWLATSFAGNLLAGWLGGLWSSMDSAHFFLMIAGIAAIAGVAIGLFIQPLRSIIET
jgi:proton-dependent oligopeptide transporter, POT family